MPTLSSKKRIPKPRKMEANRLIRSSLKMTPLSFFRSPLALLGRLTSNTKNQAVKKVPTKSRAVANMGNADGEMGLIYRTMDSIFQCVSLQTGMTKRMGSVIALQDSYSLRNYLYLLIPEKLTCNCCCCCTYASVCASNKMKTSTP